ncbi:M24 family metallopeptidase [Thermodesulfatator atlanticus]|uniref:M24 family metallopeptidase n=1 Tax=Thermodesulfatator atlanticus TaxID=501497 RepID=UPI0003B3625D|nr:Xaa-Pro peptidase family protein [Thermodesulfatator atlanticus]
MKFYQQRLKRLRLSLARLADAILITCPENRRYLSGFSPSDVSLTESSGALLITSKEAFLLTDPRYQEEAKECAPLFEPCIYRKGLVAELEKLLPLLGVKKLLVEPSYVSLSSFRLMEKKLSCEIVEARPLVEKLRAVKDEHEIKLIQESLRIAEEILAVVAKEIRPGVSEKEIAARIIMLSHLKAEGPSFPPIVASGRNAARPHAEPSDKKLALHEPLIIDMGVKWQGYCSDITRTFWVGEPDERFIKVYSLVKKAKEAAEAQIRAGVKGALPDLAAREVFKKEGVDKNFWHSLGHGVGLAIHEAPTLSFRSRRHLRPNQVVTVEPGLYFPEWGGVRLEDMVVITKQGFKRLNSLGFLSF